MKLTIIIERRNTSYTRNQGMKGLY